MGRERMGERVESGALRWRENVVDSQHQQRHGLGTLPTNRFGYFSMQGEGRRPFNLMVDNW
jgi:hypothetical protein